MNYRNARAIILNLGDGLTTSTCYLLPMAISDRGVDGKSLLLGALGGAISMAFNLRNSEMGEGTFSEFAFAFSAALFGGIMDVVPFLLFSKLVATVLAILFALGGLAIIVETQHSAGTTYKRAIRETAETVLPAFAIVGLLSFYA